MMTAQELKDRLGEESVRTILHELGATIVEDGDEYISTDTVCHHGTKVKLYYYKESKLFNCFTECGVLDVFGVVMSSLGVDFREAFDWICNTCGIQEDNVEHGVFGVQDPIEQRGMISDWDFIKGFQNKRKRVENIGSQLEVIPAVYDDAILNIFDNQYYKGWIDEGISISSMKKYNISYCIHQNKIIIPHYASNGSLIGIRGRNLDEVEAEMFGKYTPFSFGSRMYNHKTSMNFYGLHMNLDTISKMKKVMLVESEKAVLQADGFFGDDSFVLALSGMKLSTYQKNMLITMGVKEVIVGVDKQFRQGNIEETQKWADYIRKEFIVPLSPYMSVYVLWDSGSLLDYKMSPCDRGKDTLLQLMKNKIYATN